MRVLKCSYILNPLNLQQNYLILFFVKCVKITANAAPTSGQFCNIFLPNLYGMGYSLLRVERVANSLDDNL